MIEIGTSCSRSSVRRAVTMMSSIPAACTGGALFWALAAVAGTVASATADTAAYRGSRMVFILPCLPSLSDGLSRSGVIGFAMIVRNSLQESIMREIRVV